MGILTDRLPDSVNVCGRTIPLETDFRRWILFTELMTDDTADALTKLRLAVRTVCRGKEPLPLHDGAFTLGLMTELARFAALGKSLPTEAEYGGVSVQERKEQKEPEPAFDFECDGDRIYAAFQAVYGIDLGKVTLHWWRFMTLLRHLPGDCEFMRIVQLRMCDVSRVEDESARKQLRRAKAQVRIRKQKMPAIGQEPVSRQEQEGEELYG